MVSNIKLLLLIITLSLTAILSYGQFAKSPFYSFGLGEQFGTQLTQHQGMGGVGISNPQYLYINNLNPALLIYNQITVFQAGIVGEQRNQSTLEVSEKSGGTSVNHLAIAMPIIFGKWSTSFALMPYTRLNYSLKYSAPIIGLPSSNIYITEKGSGGTNEFSFSNGVKILKVLSLGLKASYIFSATVNESSNLLNSNINVTYISPNIYERNNISAFRFTPGLSLHFDSISKHNIKVNFGIVYELKSNLKSNYYQRLEQRNAQSILDTVTLVSDRVGSISKPSTIGVGFSVGKSYNWVVAIDGSYSNYTKYKDVNGLFPYGTNFWKVGIGAEYQPNPLSLTNYFNRITYRAGATIESSPYLVNNLNILDMGATLGLTFPVGRVSTIDFAIKFGKKGDKNKNKIEENYIKLYFGVSFNEQWFIKRKFD